MEEGSANTSVSTLKVHINADVDPDTLCIVIKDLALVSLLTTFKL